MNTTVSLVAEIPDSLHQELQQFLNQKTDWDFDQVLTEAIASFLGQNSHEINQIGEIGSVKNMTKQPSKSCNNCQHRGIYDLGIPGKERIYCRLERELGIRQFLDYLMQKEEVLQELSSGEKPIEEVIGKYCHRFNYFNWKSFCAELAPHGITDKVLAELDKKFVLIPLDMSDQNIKDIIINYCHHFRLI